MDYFEFLNRIIDDGIAAAREDYTEPIQQPRLRGSIAGFEACRRLLPGDLSALLYTAQEETRTARLVQNHQDTYWYARCYELEIEWVCNVVSAVLLNEKRGTIVPPTARGVLKAADILGPQCSLTT